MLIKRRTAEHATTSPKSSMPASASAVLAAIVPAATQPSMPSVSMMVMNMSIVAFGRVSSLTEPRMAWCIAIEMDLSSASCKDVWLGFHGFEFGKDILA